ncbi:unnamed protein product [Acanthoscelides obtectus]|uniref:Uncharacterized protein n=1 Tax=Acanthoscelides obtectus TaxID=200917 RepID=A0A9P0LWJ8_ACAOB|nr:unnamed protein product [Acanthoscelides obtectus]CAK1682187.1 hypothetical protein AOBTE_LOCUS33474 [Acanthoscelides obtectus]
MHRTSHYEYSDTSCVQSQSVRKEDVVLAARIENTKPKYTHTEACGSLSNVQGNQETSRTQIVQPRSYASIVGGKTVSTTKESISKVAESWTTPPENRKLESIIRVEKTENPRVVLSRLKQELTQKDTEGGFKNIRQLQKLINILKDKKDITIKWSQELKKDTRQNNS